MKNLSCTLLLFIFIFSSCKKTAIEQQPKSPLELKGGVFLVDEGNTRVSSKGMTVTIENSNPVVSAITDSLGNFSMAVPPDLPQNFALVYTKSDYGTFKRYYTYNGDSLYVLSYDLQSKSKTDWDGISGESLGYKSTVVVNSFTIQPVNQKIRMILNISSTNLTGEKYVRLFFQKTPLTILNPVSYMAYSNKSGVLQVSNGNNTFDFCARCFDCAGLNSGDTVYMTAYGDSFYNNNYTEYGSNQLIQPNVNLTNNMQPVSFVIP